MANKKTPKIDRFAGDYRWLSNFYQSKVKYNGKTYATVEHAYQAAKTTDLKVRKAIRETGNPAKAKQMGRKAKLRSGWEQMKIGIMEDLVRQKFTNDSRLKGLLIATGDAELVEGNHWGDTFWGVTEKGGQNHLGKILMRVRAELQKKSGEDDTAARQKAIQAVKKALGKNEDQGPGKKIDVPGGKQG